MIEVNISSKWKPQTSRVAITSDKIYVRPKLEEIGRSLLINRNNLSRQCNNYIYTQQWNASKTLYEASYSEHQTHIKE